MIPPDYFEIEPRFGSKEDFKELLDALHQRGMKFIWILFPTTGPIAMLLFKMHHQSEQALIAIGTFFVILPDDYSVSLL
jgi:hypothetical protein